MTRRSTNLLLVATIVLPAIAAAQPAAIPIGELTQEQFDGLGDDQRIVSGDLETTLGELRAQQAAREAAHEKRQAEARSTASERLASARAEAAAAATRQAKEDRSLVSALLAHFQRFAANHPEAVRRARELSARRAASQERWLEASAPPPRGRGRAEPVD